MSIKYATIIPLIGGMTVGNKKAVGKDPEFFLTYPGLQDNEKHCTNYFKDSPYIFIDPVSNTSEQSLSDYGKIDFVSTVCPCAGLSQLNSARNTSKARGSDAAQNEWMYKSASFVLEQIKPKVFWGENAPGLYSKTGLGVVERLKEIGRANGYSFSLVKTDTFLHGIPQHRHRTFYFFWEGDRAPILSWYKRETPKLADYLDQIPKDAKDMDRYFGMGLAETDPWFRFAASEGYSPKDLVDSPKGYKSVFDFVQDDNIDKAIAWAEANEEKKMFNFLTRAKVRLEAGQGLWVDTPILFRDATNSLVGRYTSIVHPTQPRGITVREAMWLMGLPHDFELEGNCVNHICQNVPTSTAADWTAEVVKFVKGEITEWGDSFVKQNNETQKIELGEKKKTIRVNSVI
jgi:site-specific DNA-cytosine methylase